MSKHNITIEINGESVTREVDSRKLLIHFLRDDLALTGTHIGCDTCLLYTSPSPRDS